MRLRTCACVLLVCVGSGVAQTTDQLRKMLDQNQAFALRSAVERGGDRVPVFYRGAVEESLNEVGAAQTDGGYAGFPRYGVAAAVGFDAVHPYLPVGSCRACVRDSA